MSEQIEIEINGQKIKTDPGKMIIQVADENNIYVPRFCYHKKLSIAANCRMCLVEVDKAPKTLPACATPVMPGMKVYTQSEKTLESQRIIMEFLLINHPLDCPICDQGGQCELQDFSMKYGQDASRYMEEKRSVVGDDLGPFIETEMTRCIHCTRCVRFGTEVAGVRELGVTHRGEHTQIGTYVKHTVSHELSGNVIDLCPVGALTSKPFRYQARAWELKQYPSVAPHDAVGSNINVHARRNQVMRVVPAENEAINEAWISDRDRFSYLGLNNDRLALPMIKDNDIWKEVSWQEALNFTADALEKVKAHHGKNALAAMLSANTTTEEAYLLTQVCQQLDDTAVVDYRLRQVDIDANDAVPSLGIQFSEIVEQQTILTVGAHLREEQPLLAHRIRQAALAGSKVHAIDMVAFDYRFTLQSQQSIKPSEFVVPLLKVAKALGLQGLDKKVAVLLTSIDVDAVAKQLASDLQSSEKSLIIMGAMAFNHPWSRLIQYLLSVIAEATGSTFGQLAAGANAAGCHIAGAISHGDFSRAGAYILHGIDPEKDVANPTQVMDYLLAADFVVAVTPFKSDVLLDVATVMLPMAAFAETSGTYVNAQGDWQSFIGSVKPFAQARPAWKIYRVLADLLMQDGLEFNSSQEVLEQLKNNLPSKKAVFPCPDHVSLEHKLSLERISSVASYRADTLARRSPALQEMCQLKKVDALRIHPSTAEELGISAQDSVTLIQGKQQANFEVELDAAIPEECVFTFAGGDTVASLGSLFANVSVEVKQQ